MALLRRFTGWVVCATVVAGAAGCSTSAGSDPNTFVAQNVDFRGYETWTSFTMDNPNPGGSTHVAGKRTVYINHLPPPDATAFPVGTIIVKVTEADGKIFARAKRGGDFNRTGAVNWEWFELVTKDGVTGANWRGNGPPSGEMYGGDPNAGCNLCHKLAVSNDYVLSPELRLASDVDAGGDGPSGDVATTDASPETNPSADGGVDSEQESGPDDASHE